jgi:hypothetical protein
VEPARPCSTFYEFVGRLATAIVEVWQWVPSFARWCGAANPCIWWCLCCNVWGCWLIAILIAILATILLVIFIVLAVIVVVICWIVCLIIALFIAIGSRGPEAAEPPNCFAPRYVPDTPPIDSPTGDTPTGETPTDDTPTG